ncbi:MAG TPA: VCBS repeat-containing protein [Armatimonadota bacterium]
MKWGVSFMARGLSHSTGLAVIGPIAALLFAILPAHSQCIAIGDLSGDGAPDVVTANTSGNSISVSINKHNGTVSFNAPVNYTVGAGPTSVAIADVNGDLKPDVIVCNSTPGTISVLLGNGDGTLRPATDYSVLPPGETGTPAPSAVAVGDLRGHGILDVVVSNLGTSTVSVLQGDGKGVFHATTSLPVGSKPDSITLARFTASGHLDIATANSNSRSISVLLGNGDGTFQGAQNSRAGYVPYAISAGDFDGDGVMDIAVCDNMSLSSGVNLLKGNGDGTFRNAVSFAGGTSPIAMASGDFNNDGRPDLATANTGTLDVSVFLNDCTGGFAAAITTAPGANHIGIVSGDVDGDGNAELIFSNTPSGIAVVPATAPTVKQVSLSPASVITGASSIATVLLNRVTTSDGVSVRLSTDRADLVIVPDSVVVTAGSNSTTFPVITIAPVSGIARITATTGTVAAFADLIVTPAPPVQGKGDMNGDGKLDIRDLVLVARIAFGLDPPR